MNFNEQQISGLCYLSISDAASYID